MSTQDYVDAADAIAEEMKLEVSSVLLAAGELRTHLAALEQALQAQDYGRASILGYQEISLAFVDLQRCLGGVQALHTDEYLLVQEVARERQCSEEEARFFLASLQRQIQGGE